jgi:hypothetical protein
VPYYKVRTRHHGTQAVVLQSSLGARCRVVRRASTLLLFRTPQWFAVVCRRCPRKGTGTRRHPRPPLAPPRCTAAQRARAPSWWGAHKGKVFTTYDQFAATTPPILQHRPRGGGSLRT